MNQNTAEGLVGIQKEKFEFEKKKQEEQQAKELADVKAAQDTMMNRLQYRGGLAGVDSANSIAGMKSAIDLNTRELENLNTIQGEAGYKLRRGYYENMKKMTNDYGAKFDSKIRGFMDEVLKADQMGKMDSLDDQEEFKRNLQAYAGKELENFTAEYTNQMQIMAQSIKDDQVKAQEEQAKNAKVNKDLSESVGVVMNENGVPFIDPMTGQPVPYAGGMETKTEYNPATGELMIYSFDKFGKVGNISAQKVMTPEMKNYQMQRIGNQLVSTYTMGDQIISTPVADLPPEVDKVVDIGGQIQFIMKDGSIQTVTKTNSPSDVLNAMKFDQTMALDMAKFDLDQQQEIRQSMESFTKGDLSSVNIP